MSRSAVALALVALLAAGSAGAAPSAGTAPANHVLVVTNAETGEHLLATPVSNGTIVALEYTHSVEKSRVYEAYAVRGDRLEQTRIEFESYGWGLPADANVTRENGTFVYDPDQNLTELTVQPGEIAGHELHVGTDTYDLVELSGGEAVTIYLERCSPSATVTEAETDR